MSGPTSAAEPEFDPFAGPQILATAPSTEAQREIWTATQIGTDASLAYNESVTLVMRGAVDLARLEQSFAALVARHEALRTTFSSDGLTLCINDAAPAASAQLDLSGRSGPDQEAAFSALLDEELGAPFSLEHGPLFRVRYVRFSPEETRVVLTAHHIVCDGWSTAVLLKEWAALYDKGSEAAAGLAPAPRYSDYAREELAFRGSAEHAASERYWLGRFTGELPVLELPYDRPRPPAKTYESRRYDHKLPAELAAAVKKAGAKARASLFTTLLASFKALLFRLSGQEDLVVGIPAAGQSVGGHDALVGHCVNMLPLRSRLDGQKPLAQLVGELRSTMLDAYDHQRYTFGTLLSKLPMARDASRSPLVSVVFNLDRGLTSDAIGFPALHTACLTNPRKSENFDLFLNAVELPDGVTLECQYNTALFDEATVQRWLAAYTQVLEAFVADASIPVGRLPVVSSAEKAQYARWNADSRADIPEPPLVHRLIERTATRQPEAPAVSFEGKTLSYAELNRRANQLARRLRSQGVRRGELVGVCVERSLDLIVSLVGVLKAGAAYVPLDPGYPLERLAYMAEDARVAALVAQEALLRELPIGAPHVVLVDRDTALADEPGDDLPEGADSATPSDPAYVIYTSGSTGKPKGVLLAHRSLVNLMNSVAKAPGVLGTDRVLAVTTFAFDISTSELLLPLTVGAEIVLASREVASDGARLLDLVRSQRVTFIDATPATYRLLFGAGWAGDPGITAICTGEAMPRDLAIQLAPKVKALWNGYGPTETTVWSTFYRVTEPVGRILIGKPVDNTQIHILDANREPTPMGVPGEIYIAGDGVAIGYHRRPDLTAERFVPDPFSTVPGARMYRTGDLGRYLPDGNIECLGRNDNQVKLRGYRIELGEIEDALGQHAAVQSAAVTVREDSPGDARLVGYLVAKAGATVKDAELRAHLKRTLPDYMVPATYVRLDVMPLTPSGKINRRALPAPVRAAAADTAELVAPRTPTEQLLAGLWQEALNIPRVSVHDDFFALGGHSLLASQILARLKRDHGIALSFRKMFEAPTIERLAEVIDGAGAGESAAIIPLERGDQSSAPLSVVQERLWMLEQMGEARALVHNLPAAWRFAGAVDATLLQRALDAVTARHATLRTTFVVEGGSPRQRVAERAQLTIAEVDLSSLDTAAREPRMFELIGQYTREPFDLATGPLFRSVLFRLGPEDFVYFTVRHNAIWDGWSFDIFLRDVASYYGAFASGKEPALPELPVSYGDYVRYQQKFLESPEIARQIAWWREKLVGSPSELMLPSDRPRPVKAGYGGNNFTVHLTRAEAEALTQLGRASGATLFMVLMAAYNVMLHRFSGQSEVLVGTPFRARSRPELENLIGPFVNTLVVRTKLTPSLTFGELLAQVRDTTLDCLGHEDMPLEKLGTTPPVVRALFSYQDARQRPPGLGDIPVTQVHVEPPAAANDMMLWTMETRGDLLAVLNYSTELFDASTVRRFLEGYAALLRGVLANPNAKLSDLPVVEASELARARALGEPAGAEAPSVAALVAELAARGAAPAVHEAGSTLDYAALAGAAQAAAAALDELPDDAVVALYAARAADRLALLLGAALRGLSALVLDPALPVSRSRALLEASRARAVLAPSDTSVPSELGLPTVSPRAGATPSKAAATGTLLGYTFDARGRAQPWPVAYADLLAGARALAAELGVAAGERLVGLLPASSPLALYELTLALGVGASYAPGGSPADAQVLFAAPVQLAKLSGAELSTPRVVAAAGAPSRELAQRLLDEGAARLVRVDAWPSAGLAPFVQPVQKAYEARRLGRPLYPARVIIGEGAGVGVPGELHVATVHGRAGGVARAGFGALGFVPTGARARLLEDGAVDVLSISEQRVELRGVPVELGEIEHSLAQHPSVAAAAVVLKPTKTGVGQLVAFVVAESGRPYIESEIRSQLKKALPDYALPQQIDEVEDLPLRADGTVDRSELVRRAQRDGEGAFVAPRTDTERALAEIWQGALGVARVGVHDNFFDLGGHSLLCFKVIGQIEQRLGQRIGPRIMFLGTLEQVASELGRSPKAPAQPAATQRAPEPPKDPSGGGKGLFARLKGLVKG